MNKLEKLMIIIIILILLLISTGCEKKEEKKCIESHTEKKNLYFYNGGSMTFMPVSRNVCDKYEGEDSNE